MRLVRSGGSTAAIIIKECDRKSPVRYEPTRLDYQEMGTLPWVMNSTTAIPGSLPAPDWVEIV